MQPLILLGLAVFILDCVALWRLFVKAGQPGWAALVPLYNAYVLLKIARRPGWWVLLLLIPGVNLIVAAIVFFALAKAFGRGPGFGLGLTLLGFIYLPVLAFGPATCGTRDSVAGSPPAAPAPPLSFAQQLARLEQANRGLKVGFVWTALAALAAVGVTIWSVTRAEAPGRETTRMRQLDIVDASGSSLVRFEELTRHGNKGLGIFGSSGPVAFLYVAAGAPRFELFDLDHNAVSLRSTGVILAHDDHDLTWLKSPYGGEPGALLHLGGDRSGQVALEAGVANDPDGSIAGGQLNVFDARNPTGKVTLSADAEGGHVRVANPEGQAMVAVNCIAQGGAIDVIGTNGKLAVGLAALETGGMVSVSGATGRPAAALDATSLGGRFGLLDDAGKMRAILGISPVGSSLALYHADGTRRVSLAAEEERGDVGVYGAKGARAATLRAAARGGEVIVNNDAGRNVVALAVSEYGGALALLNNSGALATNLSVARTGHGNFVVCAKGGSPVATVGVSAGGDGQFNLNNQGGHLIVGLGTASAGGAGTLQLASEAGRPLAQLGLPANSKHGELHLFDPSTGQKVFQTP